MEGIPDRLRPPATFAMVAVLIILLAGCGSRQLQDSLVGSTAQRLVTHSIDDLVGRLPDSDFAGLAGQRLFLSSHFIEYPDIREYADRRLAIELARRFDIEIVAERRTADAVLNVFYTSLGTDQGYHGFYVPLGFVPGMNETTRVNLITLEQFHGVAEMYYFIGETGTERRGDLIRARTRSDALGLPIITIPISTIERR
ncbi:MAG: hypothetical protein ACOCSR_01890 [Wenzhouxiangella sp.]